MRAYRKPCKRVAPRKLAVAVEIYIKKRATAFTSTIYFNGLENDEVVQWGYNKRSMWELDFGCTRVLLQIRGVVIGSSGGSFLWVEASKTKKKEEKNGFWMNESKTYELMQVKEMSRSKNQ